MAWDGVRWVSVGSAQQSTANRGHKLIGELRGGCLDDFFAGVTGIVGDPHVNIEEGIRKEHVLNDSAELITTGKYGITYLASAGLRSSSLLS